MSDWQTIRQDIEILDKRLSQPDRLGWEDLRDIYEERIFLRHLLYRQSCFATTDEVVEAAKATAECGYKLQELIISRLSSNREEVREWLSAMAEHYYREIGRLGTDGDASPEIVGATLQGFAGDLSFLKRLSLLLEKNQDQSSLLDIANEISYVLNTDRLRAACRGQEFLSRCLSQLRKDTLTKKVEALSREVDKLGEGPKEYSRMRQLLLWGNAIASIISRSDPAHRPLRKICREQRDKIRNMMEDYFRGCEAKVKWEALEKLAMDIYDQANEVLSQIEENTLALAIKQLESVRDDIEWAVSLLKRAGKEEEMPEAPALQYKKLRRMSRYLRAELQEKKLQERLEGIFGKRFVAFFENLILFLIFAVIVLLTVEFTSAMSTSTQRLLLWVDAGICFVFLLEFFTKLALADGKMLYFRRHWLIDLLPSIPFGLLLLHAEALQTVDYSRSARAVRLLRLSRLVRYIRILRPIIRIFRLFSLLMRGLDRMVRRYSKWLNRSIVFFGSADEIGRQRQRTLRESFQESYSRCLARSRMIFRAVPVDEIKPYLASYIAALDVRVQRSNGGGIIKEEEMLSKEVLVEDVVRNLLNIQGAKVEEILGSDFPQQVYRYVGFLDAPVVRRLPYLRTFLKLRREAPPAEFTARLGRALGRLLERILSLLYWIMDLYGIVTGPRLVDRLGNTLVSSFQRPARRLLFVGASFVILDFLARAMPFELLKVATGVLDKYVGLPVIILGGICLFPLVLGMWLKNIGGEATGFYENTVEAQFINLLKELKLQNSERDLHILYTRVLQPELLLNQSDHGNTFRRDNLVQQMRSELSTWIIENHGEGSRITTKQEARRWKLLHQVMLLYKDYLDGALLHQSDVKTTEQLLGNITLRNIMVHRLGFGKKEFRELDKLDLSRGRSILGPYLWFTMITQSVAHNTAQLIIEYNTHSIRDTMLGTACRESIDSYRNWLARKKCCPGEREEERKPKGQKTRDTKPFYHTTLFTALHFLSCHPTQDESVRLDFESDLYRIFLEDRKQTIREVFGSYPLHALPKSRRTFNFYHLYMEYVSGGRIFVLPIRMAGWSFTVLKIVLKWFCCKIEEILHPAMGKDTVPPAADFQVVVRKVNRMRKPVYMECMKLRARFDFQYLGLPLPGTPDLPMHEPLILNFQATPGRPYYMFEHDLDFIHALADERSYFYDLRQERLESLHYFQQFLAGRGWPGENFDRYLAEKKLGSRKNEILRALAIAFAIDYRKFASLVKARDAINRVFREAIAREGQIDGYRRYRRFLIFLYRLGRKWVLRQGDWEKESFDRFWEQAEQYRHCGVREKKWCWKAYLTHRPRLEELLFFINQEGSVKIIEEILEHVVCHPGVWTEELIAIRTIQALSVLDVENYRRHIATLGEYPEKAHYCDPAPIHDGPHLGRVEGRQPDPSIASGHGDSI